MPNDNELWNSIAFITEILNRVRVTEKLTVIDFHKTLKSVIKKCEYDYNGPDDLILTIFVEFFYCFHDDGENLYRYYYRDDRKVTYQTFIVMNEGKRELYQSLPTDTWYTSCDSCLPYFPSASTVWDGRHYFTRALLRFLAEHDVIKREWLTDYNDEKESYEMQIYEAINFQLHELTEVRDPYGIIDKNEVEKLYNSIKLVCDALYNRYQEHPEEF